MSVRVDSGDQDPVEAAQATLRLSRRLVLGLLASAAGAAGAAAQPVNAAAARTAIGRDGSQIDPNLARVQQGGIATLSEILIPILRPDDLLVLYVVLRNLQVTQGANRQITVINPAQPGLMLVSHQAQTVFEEAFQENPLQPSPAPPFVANSRLAGPTLIVYEAPQGFTSLPFTLKDILGALSSWPMRLDVNAQPVPPDPLDIVHLLHASDAVKLKLVGAAAALKTQLSASQSPAAVKTLERAGERLSRSLSDAARQGRSLSDRDLSAAVAAEVNTSLGPRAANPRDRVLASGFVESLASIGLVSQLVPLTFLPKPPRELPGDVTSIELPYKLFQSPLATAGWTHATDVVTHASHTELWHSRLGTRVGDQVVELDGEPLRALWTPDYPPPSVTSLANSAALNLPLTPQGWAAMPMTRSDRIKLVALTADWGKKQKSGQAYVPQPSLAKRLMLTALGATLDLDGSWPVRPDGADIEAWNHRAAIGRDYYVRIVYAGFLYPFGHAASYVKVTERKFETQANGGRIAVLRQREFIIVREHTKTYPGPNQAYAGRDLPFQTVEITTKVTPNLMNPQAETGMPSGYYSGADYYEGFWPRDGATGQDFNFHLVGVDGAGRRIPFEMPLFFLSENKNTSPYIQDIAVLWTKPANAARTKASMNGAKVQFAPQTVGADSNGDTSFPVGVVSFAGAPPTGAISVYRAQFYPSVVQAGVDIPSVKALIGAKAQPQVKFSPTYLVNAFDAAANRGQLFLDMVTPPAVPIDPSHPTDKFGGLISPGLVPSGLSRSFGAVQGAAVPFPAIPGAMQAAATFSSGKFDPADFIPDDAKLLGAVKLKDVLHAIQDVAGDLASATQAAQGAAEDAKDIVSSVPKLTNVELPDRIIASYTLKQTGLHEVGPFIPKPSSVLTINSQVVLKRDGTPPQATVDATLTDFKVNLFGCIILTFVSLELKVVTGAKTDVIPKLDPQNGVLFGGPLEFVNGLRDVIPMDGFSDPPGLSVTPAGITASYSLTLPDISIGVASLSNVSLGAGFDLPFTGEAPSARFNFAERQSPFNLTISLFGGGGFFAITVGTDGVREIEAALEFGAQISIDLGVASGGVYVKGGFYFHWIGATSEVDFEGYVEMGGHLSVIGLITVSLVFHLALDYQKLPPNSQLFGQATLTVEVDILFFSVSVGVHVERQFAGSKSDPSFLDFVGAQSVWTDYCDAFA